MKIAVINCYHMPDYVRAQALREAVKAQPSIETFIIKNTRTNILRYPEVIWKTIKLRLQENPDIYLLTFRGQEILPLVLAIAGRKQVWFDEFIVPGAYLKQEKRKKSLKNTIKTTILKLGLPVYSFFLKRCDKILIDTDEHVEISSELSGISRDRYLSMPVGTDESLFYPQASTKPEKFRIFYYSSVMQPLLGIPVVLKAAELLKENRDFEFVLVGGKGAMTSAVEESRLKGANIIYKEWVKFEEIPDLMRESNLVLGGPFGGTPQANKVITGKTYQSIACAQPTVVGKNKSAGPYFIDKKNCLLAEQNNPQALVEIFKWAKDNPEALEQIGKEGRKLYEEQFSSTALQKIIADLIAKY